VFKHLDTKALCTTIPLVCQHWRATAACDQLWTPRCDPLLLAAVQPQPPADTASSAEAAAAGPCCYTVALPRLHHAVYTFNLLRNPLFLAAANAGYSSGLPRTRSGSSGSSSDGGGSGSARPQAVLTPEQRKLAWVSCLKKGRGGGREKAGNHLHTWALHIVMMGLSTWMPTHCNSHVVLGCVKARCESWIVSTLGVHLLPACRLSAHR
jgi:hypothetical protein